MYANNRSCLTLRGRGMFWAAERLRNTNPLARCALASALVLVGIAPGASAAQLSIRSATISFDPNADTWYVSSYVCNDDRGGNSGSLLYELKLVTSGGTSYSIGSTRDSNVLYGGYCRTQSNLAISVNRNVPAGTYEIKLVVGDYNGSGYVERARTTFNRNFVKGGSGSSGGSNGGGSSGSGSGGSGSGGSGGTGSGGGSGGSSGSSGGAGAGNDGGGSGGLGGAGAGMCGAGLLVPLGLSASLCWAGLCFPSRRQAKSAASIRRTSRTDRND